MKKFLTLLFLLCLLTGCTDSPGPAPTTAAVTETTVPALRIVTPLPVTIDMNDLTNCTLAISLEEGGAYVDDNGYMQMDVTVYTYDRYDQVDISRLQPGDTILLRRQEVLIETLEESPYGTLMINGGLDVGGYELIGKDTVYFETGYSDVKSWYSLGTATLRVSPDFTYTNRSNPDAPATVFFPGDFLYTDSGIDYHFTPHNTTITIQDGLIISMERIYTP